MGIVDEPIFRGYVPFQIMDEIEPEFAKAHGLTSDPGRMGGRIRFFWLTKTLIMTIEFPRSTWAQGEIEPCIPAVRCLLRINKHGHLDNLGLEGLMEPEAQDALKSWTVLAQMTKKPEPDPEMIKFMDRISPRLLDQVFRTDPLTRYLKKRLK